MGAALVTGSVGLRKTAAASGMNAEAFGLVPDRVTRYNGCV